MTSPSPTAATPSTPSANPSDADAIDLVFDLVREYSPSRNELPASRRLAERAAALGLHATVDDTGNFVASTHGDPLRSSPDCRDIVLLGHIDTVPGEIPVRIDDGILHGRGSVDAKGPLATFVIAAARLRDRLPAGVRLVVIGAVEEETPTSRGARAVVDRYQPIACMIGEPSGTSGVTVAYKGRLVVRAETTRSLSHTAGPDRSAADRAVAWWSRVQTRTATLADPAASPFRSLQHSVRTMHASDDGFNDRAELVAGFRLPPSVTPEQLKTVCLEEAGSDVSLTFVGAEVCFEADPKSGLVRSLTGAIRSLAPDARPRILYKTGTSDMNVVGPAWRCPIAAFGPGDSALDHTPQEHLVLDEYLLACRVLDHALARFVSEAVPAESIQGQINKS
jgi:LysW-gamma-L-lysine carboxypeptidase